MNPVEYLGLSGAARHFKIDGKSVHGSTVFRWIRDGVTVNGHRVRLGAVRLGRRLTTTTELIETFRRELTEAERSSPFVRPRECQSMAPRKRTSEQRAKDIERAERELARQ